MHAVSIAEFALTTALGWAAQSLNPRLHLRAEIERLEQEIQLLREEIRIMDARMQHIEAQKRPHYPPTARLAILELRAARNWSLVQAARIFLVTPTTIASWTARVDEEGPDALVRLPEPVNKFPDFVGYLVRRLKILCPTLGKVKIAQVLARAVVLPHKWGKTSPPNVGPELRLQIRRHHVAVQRVRQKIIEWDHPRARTHGPDC